MKSKSIVLILLLVVASIGISSLVTYNIMHNRTKAAIAQANSNLTKVKNEFESYKKQTQELQMENQDLTSKNQELVDQVDSLSKKLNVYFTQNKK